MSTTAEQVAWQTRAQCVGVDPEVFFPDRGQPTRIAKWICRRCPVQQQCLDYALAERIEDGIWGGLSGIERGQLLPKVVKSRAPERARPVAARRSPLVDCPCREPSCRRWVARGTRNEHLRRQRARAAA